MRPFNNKSLYHQAAISIVIVASIFLGLMLLFGWKAASVITGIIILIGLMGLLYT